MILNLIIFYNMEKFNLNNISIKLIMNLSENIKGEFEKTNHTIKWNLKLGTIDMKFLTYQSKIS